MSFSAPYLFVNAWGVFFGTLFWVQFKTTRNQEEYNDIAKVQKTKKNTIRLYNQILNHCII